MLKPERPADEAKRLEVLHSLHILDTAPEDRYDRITRLAQRLFKVPVALISLVDENRQWFKSKQGWHLTETSRDQALAAQTVLSGNLFCISNLADDPRFANNPQVSGAPHLRFYAGAALRTSAGYCVGSLCLFDTQARDFSEADKAALRDLADGAEAELARSEMAELIQQVRSTKIRYRNVMDTVLDAIITVDKNGLMQTVNAAVTRLFGYENNELIGQDVAMLMPEPHRSQHSSYLQSYLNTGVTHILGKGRQLIGQRKDGSQFPMELAVSRMDISGELYFTGTIRDITLEKAAAKQLHEVNAQRQAILDAANFTIISTDIDGVIRTFNRGAQQMLGYSEEEVVGKITPAVIHDLDEVVARAGILSKELGRTIEPGFEAFVAKAKLGYIDENEWTYVRKDGGRFPVLLSVAALRDQQGNINGFVGIGSDITERKKIDRMKAEFVSTVSHELRTPLTSIRGALGLVLGKASEGLSDKARKLLETANRNSERLTMLINDILDLEKIESGKLEFNFSHTDLVMIAHQALQANEGYAARHSVRLVMASAPEVASIWGDELRLMQVFANLLSNAIKYSAADSEVEVCIESLPGAYRVNVIDHGVGIPEEFRDRIFGRFAQVDSTDSREKGGTGLGLSITKAIVERHEGKIDYHSSLGNGSCFYFDIPKASRPALENFSADSADILICEDDQDVARLLNLLLEREGLSGDIAHTARAAKLALKNRHYNALLLDLNLPDADGLELLKTLRETDATRLLPVIIVSGRDDPGERNRPGGNMPVVDWLCKPIDPAKLSKALIHALRNHQRKRILHVEDDCDIIEITRSLLDDEVDYVACQSFVEASQRLRNEFYDLLLLDIALPDGSGLDLIKVAPAACQVIIFSGMQSINVKANEKVSAVLTKSQVNNDTLLAVIKHSIYRTKDKP